MTPVSDQMPEPADKVNDLPWLTDDELEELDRQDASDAAELARLDNLAHYTTDVLSGACRPACGAPHPSVMTDRMEHVTCQDCANL